MTDHTAHDSPSERDVADDIASHDITCVDCGRAMRVVTDANGRLRSEPCDCVANLRAGQLVFNALAEVDADFAERIRGTELSPFYRDEVTADTLRAWRDSIVAAAEKRAATPPDDPEADGTDAAHPAWWRGNDAGCKGSLSLVARLRADNDALRARVAELERLAAGPATTETVAMTPEMIATWGRVLG